METEKLFSCNMHCKSPLVAGFLLIALNEEKFTLSNKKTHESHKTVESKFI